jgi:hypothetical protein
MSRACGLNEGTRNAYGILVGKQKGKRPLGRSRHRWVDNSKMDSTDIGLDDVDLIDLAQDRDLDVVMKFGLLYNVRKFKNTVFSDVTRCGSCKNLRFGGTYRLHHQGDNNRRARNNVSN